MTKDGPEQSTIAGGGLTRRRFLGALAGGGMAASGLHWLSDAAAGLAQTAQARYLVIISMDAFRPDYRQMAPMPALDALIARGTSYDRAWVGQLESNTPSSHVTISTGVFPRRHGILGFEWRDPRSGKESLDGWAAGVFAGNLERDLRLANTGSIAGSIKKADRAARVISVSSEKVYAATGMGGPAADFILYCDRDAKNRFLYGRAIPGHLPPASFFTQHPVRFRLPRKHFADWDYLSARLALAGFDTYRPRALLINLPGADVYGHEFGGPADPFVMRKVVAGLDRSIRRIVNAYQKAGILNETLFVVTADHGMVPNDHTVTGSEVEDAVKRAGGEYYFHTGGTAAFIYLKKSAASRAVANAMAKVPNVLASYYLDRPHGGYAYVRAPQSAVEPALDAAHAYLLQTFAGPAAPDVVAQYRENTIGNKRDTLYGYHGGMNWGAQSIPLVLAGPGIRAGARSSFPARLVDIAPTVLRMLGLPPIETDGVVLADALSAPSTAETAVQTSHSAGFGAYVEALAARSAADIASDVRKGIKPPPPLAPHP